MYVYLVPLTVMMTSQSQKTKIFFQKYQKLIPLAAMMMSERKIFQNIF